jgi:hypothetical protein
MSKARGDVGGHRSKATSKSSAKAKAKVRKTPPRPKAPRQRVTPLTPYATKPRAAKKPPLKTPLTPYATKPRAAKKPPLKTPLTPYATNFKPAPARLKPRRNARPWVTPETPYAGKPPKPRAKTPLTPYGPGPGGKIKQPILVSIGWNTRGPSDAGVAEHDWEARQARTTDAALQLPVVVHPGPRHYNAGDVGTRHTIQGICTVSQMKYMVGPTGPHHCVKPDIMAPWAYQSRRIVVPSVFGSIAQKTADAYDPQPLPMDPNHQNLPPGYYDRLQEIQMISWLNSTGRFLGPYGTDFPNIPYPDLTIEGDSP